MPLFRDNYEVPEELLNDLRSRFFEVLHSEPEDVTKYHPDDVEQVKNNDWFIARYLLHQELDVDNALKMMLKSLEFRNEMGINTLKKEDFPKEYFDAGEIQIYNHDKNNFPIVALRLKVHNKIPDETRLQQQFLLFWIEKAVRMDDWNLMVFLLDCTDAAYKNSDIDMVKFLSQLFKEFYPWTMYTFIVYNLPWYLSAIWQLAKVWVPEKHLNRIAFVDEKSILEYVDEDQLPVCMGGTCTDPYD